MSKTIIFIVLSVFNAILIAFADGYIKKATLSGSLVASFKGPWLYLAVVFYLVQIALVAYLFLEKWQLGVLANVFVVFYSISTVVLGYVMFAEKLALIQILGIVLGIIGVFMMTR